MPTLYLVATPIGNLEDITLRALETLKQVGLIAAEDTRKTRRLLSTYNIKTRLTSYHEHNKRAKLPHLLQQLGEKDVALVSEAGMPGISDPGYELVVATIEHEIPVVAIPGPSVLPAALAISGLPTHQFLYLGFLPRRQGPRRRLLESVAGEPRTLVAFEAPHRLLSTLDDLFEVLGDRRIAVCRELTKLHEEVFRGTVAQAREHFAQPKGEFTLVISGEVGEREAGRRGEIEKEIEKKLRRLKKEGLSAREAVARVAGESGLPKKEVYRRWLELG